MKAMVHLKMERGGGNMHKRIEFFPCRTSCKKRACTHSTCKKDHAGGLLMKTHF